LILLKVKEEAREGKNEELKKEKKRTHMKTKGMTVTENRITLNK